MKNIKIGEIYKTEGGWDALVVYICSLNSGFYAIHKPNSIQESSPIFHRVDGTSTTALSVNERPCYGKHPADIILQKE